MNSKKIAHKKIIEGKMKWIILWSFVCATVLVAQVDTYFKNDIVYEKATGKKLNGVRKTY